LITLLKRVSKPLLENASRTEERDVETDEM